ncbi:hypothetical protein Taro_036836, partial [Colocasia esculenta]|nr:hypothetical protein [Colocasia esculenta]
NPTAIFCNPFLGAVRWLQWHQRVCSSLTSWRVRGPGWFCLWALDLVEVRGNRADGETSVSRGCSVSLVVTPGCSFPTPWSLLSRRVRAEGCFRIVFDSAGSAGVVSGPTLVFLLLWLVRDWLSLLSLVREAHPPYCLQVASFPAGFKCELQESVVVVAGCTCYERGCWFARAAVEFVISLHVRVAVLRRLREPTYGVSFTGAGLWLVDPVEVGVFARAKQMLVCCVAPLVERCDT